MPLANSRGSVIGVSHREATSFSAGIAHLGHLESAVLTAVEGITHAGRELLLKADPSPGRGEPALRSYAYEELLWSDRHGLLSAGKKRLNAYLATCSTACVTWPHIGAGRLWPGGAASPSRYCSHAGPRALLAVMDGYGSRGLLRQPAYPRSPEIPAIFPAMLVGS